MGKEIGRIATTAGTTTGEKDTMTGMKNATTEGTVMSADNTNTATIRDAAHPHAPPPPATTAADATTALSLNAGMVGGATMIDGRVAERAGRSEGM